MAVDGTIGETHTAQNPKITIWKFKKETHYTDTFYSNLESDMFSRKSIVGNGEMMQKIYAKISACSSIEVISSLTSTSFPMLLFPLLNSTEQPELNRCTSRQRGLCPATILLTPKP